MKRKELKQKAICSCCNGILSSGNLKETLGKKIWIWGMERQIEYDDLAYGEYQFACDICLNSGKAVKANPKRQEYCDFDPYLAYFDIQKVCEECGRNYIFARDEQRFWYEEKRFWVQSRPKACPECRKEKRYKKRINAELSTLLKDKENLTIQDMERLSEIYTEINKPEKTNYYKNLIEKQKRNQE